MNEAQKLISEHQLVNIDNYIYVVDGVCVVIEPDSLDFTDVRQLQDLFQYITVFKTDAFLNERRGKNNTYIHLSDYANELEKNLGFGNLANIPVDKLKIVRSHFAMNCPPPFTSLSRGFHGMVYANVDMEHPVVLKKDELNKYQIRILERGIKVPNADMKKIFNHPWEDQLQKQKTMRRRSGIDISGIIDNEQKEDGMEFY